MKRRSISIVLALSAVAGHAPAAEGPSASAAKVADVHPHDHERGHDSAEGIGEPGVAARVSRTIAVEMSDAMRFEPAGVSARQGETVRFKIKNVGKVKHEFVLDTEAALMEHAELMKKFPEMEHSDPNRVSVASGQTGEVIWQFTRAGTIHFACLQPGHYDAGMKGVVNVIAVKGAVWKDHHKH